MADAALAGPAPRSGTRLRALVRRASGALDPHDEREFGLALDRSLSGSLPALGAAFGAGVLLFSAWDH